MPLETPRCFLSDGLPSKIVSIFYDKDRPIAFDSKKVSEVLGYPEGTIRRTISEMKSAGCITVFKHGFHATYIITTRNAYNFSRNVANDKVELTELKTKKIKNKRSNDFAKQRTSRANKGLDIPHGECNEECANCHKFFTWNGLRRHLKYCKKKQLSFVRN